MPMVDDPHDFGRIAATNAISDVYAMGGTPVMALAILGMPLTRSHVEITVRKILKAARRSCASAGIPVAGGHSIDRPEPVYGLAVIGTCRPDHARRNADCAKPAMRIILTKPLGVGIYSAAIKKDAAAARRLYGHDRLDVTLLNRIGSRTRATMRTCTRSPMSPVSASSAMGWKWRAARARRSGSTSDLPFLAGRAAGTRGARHWSLAPQLGELWRRRRAAGGLPSGSATSSPTRRRLAGCWWPARRGRGGAARADQGCRLPSARIVGTVEAGPAKVVVV